MKKTLIIGLMLLLFSWGWANEGAEPRWQVFTELDVLPYATGGYYFSLGTAGKQIRLRAVHAMVNIPAFATPEGFEDYQNRATAVIADYFPGKSGTQRGLWIGSGLEYWQNSLRNQDDHTTCKFDQIVFTTGVGYIIPIGSHFFLNPWAAGHLALQGKQDKQIGNSTAQIPGLMSEGSLKLGWRF